LQRIFRLTIRCSIKYNNELLIFSIGKKIFELDLKTLQISSGFILKNSRPFSFEEVKGVSSVADGIYFGEYKINSLQKSVSIYKRVGIDNWKVVYDFPEGTIEHVHRIISDEYNDTVYILTGDFEDSAAIWEVKDNFEIVRPLLRGSQDYRACVAFSTSKGLVYGTDSPFSKNSIRVLQKDLNGEWCSVEICSINGPCLYGIKFNDEFVFSTSVEGEGNSSNLFYNLINNRRGKGIIDENISVYKGSLKNGFELIYQNKKDKLPYLLFQFGAICFPSGEVIGEFLPMFEIATKKNSMSTTILRER
jgi:hypothetical protein